VRKNGSDTTAHRQYDLGGAYSPDDRPVDGVPDPQLHCHATVFNATFDSVENRWKAIQLGDIVRDKGYYQAAFPCRLASKLKDLGYGIEKDGNSFKLAGIDRATAEKFSRRTAVIEAEAERLGIDRCRSKRQARPQDAREEKQRSRQHVGIARGMGQPPHAGRAAGDRTAASGWEKGDAAITPEQAKEYALEHSFQNASAVSEKRLKAEALTYAVGSVRPEDVADIAQHPEVIAEMRDGQLMATTKPCCATKWRCCNSRRTGSGSKAFGQCR
jgi:hypothetical protein